MKVRIKINCSCVSNEGVLGVEVQIHSFLTSTLDGGKRSSPFPGRCTWCVQVLRSPKEAFAAAMQSWRERCEKCVCLQGDYVKK